MHILGIPSLRWRLIAVMCLAYVTVAIASAVASYKVQESNLHDQLVRQARSDAALVAASAANTLAVPNARVNILQPVLQDVLSSLRKQSSGVTYVYLIGGSGPVISYGNGRPFSRAVQPTTVELQNGGEGASVPIITHSAGILGVAGVIISNRDVQNALTHSLIVDVALRLAGLVIFVLLSLVIARYVLGPLAVLYRAAEAIRGGQLSTRVSLNEGTELTTVAEAFNHMASSLERRIGQLSFLAYSGAVLPNTLRESGDLTRILEQFCAELDTSGVTLLTPGEPPGPGVVFSRKAGATEWESPARTFAAGADSPTAGDLDGYSIMAVPVLGDARFATARPHGHPFSVEEQQLITNFAYQVGIAADNARLFEAQQEALRVKDQFLSIVSHELRTPLTTIKGYSQMLKRRLGDDPEGNRFAETIDAQVARLSRLVDDLLDVTRFARGQFDLQTSDTDLRPILEDVVARFRLVAPGHGLELQAPTEMPRGHWDHDRLEQVMNNLVSNAIKYSPNGGTVTVSARAERDQVVVGVRDQGMGIAPEDQERLFERFFRANTVGQDIKGMGLGLYVTQRIVEAHGGQISLQSVPGQGSEFTFTLPLAAVPTPTR